MSSFDSISFSERGTANGALLPLHGSEVTTTVTTIPGGSKVYLQVGRRKPVRLSLPIKCTAAQLASLRGVVKTSASLVYTAGTFTATLEEIQEPKEVKQPNDVFFVTLALVI